MIKEAYTTGRDFYLEKLGGLTAATMAAGTAAFLAHLNNVKQIRNAQRIARRNRNIALATGIGVPALAAGGIFLKKHHDSKPSYRGHKLYGDQEKAKQAVDFMADKYKKK